MKITCARETPLLGEHSISKCLIQITEEEIDGKWVKMVHDINLLS